MDVVNVRLDDRLIHGVVATNWIPRLEIQRAVVLDKESMENPTLKSSLRMATPKSCFLSVIDTEKFLNNDRENRYGKERIMIVVKSFDPLIELINAGFPIHEVTLGNMGRQGDTAGAVAVTRYLAVKEQTIAQVEYLHAKGVKLTAQLIPENDPVDFYSAMQKALK